MFTFPRIFWVNKSWTLKQVHYEVFQYLKPTILEQYKNASDSKSKYNLGLPQIKKLSISEDDEDQNYSYEEFVELTPQEQFNVCFPELNEREWKEVGKRNNITTRSVFYQIKIKNTVGYLEDCYFCKDQRCEGCPLPFTDEKYEDLLKKMGQKHNQSFFSDSYSKKGKFDVIFSIAFAQNVKNEILDPFT